MPMFAGSVAHAQQSQLNHKDVSLPPKEKFYLYLLVGQSNMAGRDTVEEQDTVPNPRVLTFTKDETWVPAVDPIHFDKPKAVGVGLGRTFGIDMAEAHPGVTIGLIPCAAGGSPIDTWKPGAFHEQTNSHPWDDAIARAKKAMQFGVLKGILWHQGEGDSSPGKSNVYSEKLQDLVTRFRTELDAPDVPFIVGQLGNFPEKPWSSAKKEVDLALRSLPEQMPHCGFVSSEGLTDRGDSLHFDSKSCREFGHRYAKVYLEMEKK